MRRSLSKSAHKCIPYNNRCVQNFYPDRLRFGSTRGKTCFGVKNLTAKPVLGRQKNLKVYNAVYERLHSL